MSEPFPGARINLSLVSHTNVGKTTLARTLLLRDVGTVADQPHATLSIEPYVLAEGTDGSQLILWDTPGFGNSVVLAQRLRGRSNPVGWFTSQIWDRLANKSFWLDQQILLHIQDISSVVLYLVNLSESPQDTPYIQAEMEILAWLGKPVIVLLNQMGAPLAGNQEQNEIAAWKTALKPYHFVHSILPMDAFARCWVLEKALFTAIGEVLPTEEKIVYTPLEGEWWQKRTTAYRASVAAIAQHLSAAASMQSHIATPSLGQKALRTAQRWGLFTDRADPQKKAQDELVARNAANFRALTQELLHCNGLVGEATEKSILERMQTDWNVSVEAMDSQSAAAIGTGIGMAAGLVFDIASAGLSLGAGTVIGSALGAAGGAGAARAYNMAKKKNGALLSWGDQALANFLQEDLLLYLAIAHFGRGRGNWQESESPTGWKKMAQEAVDAQDISFSGWRKLPAPEAQKTMEQCVDAIVRRMFLALYGELGRF